MDTNKLHYFSVLAQTENVRKASEVLDMTPSALSKIVRQMEDELKIKLIIPLGRGITLTKEGKIFAQKSIELLKSFENIKDEIRETKFINNLGPIKIATFEVFSTYFLQVLEEMDINHRGLALYEVLPGELEIAVEQGKVDVGITYLPIPHPNVEHLKISSIMMGVYKRKNAFKGLVQNELPFVVPIYPLNGTPTRIRGLDGWPSDAYDRKIQYEVTLLESAMELCRQGKCAGYFPSFIVEKHNKKYKDQYCLERHPSPYGTKRCYSDVYIVKRKDMEEDKTIKLVAKMVRLGTKVETLQKDL
jgi:DNA-binding transcriptional LysR family regulator